VGKGLAPHPLGGGEVGERERRGGEGLQQLTLPTQKRCWSTLRLLGLTLLGQWAYCGRMGYDCTTGLVMGFALLGQWAHGLRLGDLGFWWATGRIVGLLGQWWAGM